MAWTIYYTYIIKYVHFGESTQKRVMEMITYVKKNNLNHKGVITLLTWKKNDKEMRTLGLNSRDNHLR